MYNLYGRESNVIFQKMEMKEEEWVRKFAFFLVEVGTVDGERLDAWLEYYEVRHVVKDSRLLREYRLPNPPAGFKSRITGIGIDIT